ncbi:MAG: 4Fe-4S binding protein, partial [Deltaproteobacteria bacterium]
MTDLLAGAESFVASWNFTVAFWTGLLLPLLLTLLLGRVFCGWICPAGFLFDMTAKVRTFVKFLEIHPPSLRIWRGNKYVL